MNCVMKSCGVLDLLVDGFEQPLWADIDRRHLTSFDEGAGQIGSHGDTRFHTFVVESRDVVLVDLGRFADPGDRFVGRVGHHHRTTKDLGIATGPRQRFGLHIEKIREPEQCRRSTHQNRLIRVDRSWQRG